LLAAAQGYRGVERRASPRVPKTLEISVQPLDDQMREAGPPFFAITRDISQGGLAFLSGRQLDCEKAVIALQDGIAPGVVCRICNQSVLHGTGIEEVWLANVQFLYVYRRRRKPPPTLDRG
jgi:hypothetical protein